VSPTKALLLVTLELRPLKTTTLYVPTSPEEKLVMVKSGDCEPEMFPPSDNRLLFLYHW